jgi:hypothetical protein
MKLRYLALATLILFLPSPSQGQQIDLGNAPIKYYREQNIAYCVDCVATARVHSTTYLVIGTNPFATSLTLKGRNEKRQTVFSLTEEREAVNWREVLPPWIESIFRDKLRAYGDKVRMLAAIIRNKEGKPIIVSLREGELTLVPFCGDSNRSGCSWSAIEEFARREADFPAWVQKIE